MQHSSSRWTHAKHGMLCMHSMPHVYVYGGRHRRILPAGRCSPCIISLQLMAQSTATCGNAGHSCNTSSTCNLLLLLLPALSGSVTPAAAAAALFNIIEAYASPAAPGPPCGRCCAGLALCWGCEAGVSHPAPHSENIVECNRIVILSWMLLCALFLWLCAANKCTANSIENIRHQMHQHANTTKRSRKFSRYAAFYWKSHTYTHTQRPDDRRCCLPPSALAP